MLALLPADHGQTYGIACTVIDGGTTTPVAIAVEGTLQVASLTD